MALVERYRWWDNNNSNNSSNSLYKLQEFTTLIDAIFLAARKWRKTGRTAARARWLRQLKEGVCGSYDDRSDPHTTGCWSVGKQVCK